MECTSLGFTLSPSSLLFGKPVLTPTIEALYKIPFPRVGILIPVFSLLPLGHRVITNRAIYVHNVVQFALDNDLILYVKLVFGSKFYVHNVAFSTYEQILVQLLSDRFSSLIEGGYEHDNTRWGDFTRRAERGFR